VLKHLNLEEMVGLTSPWVSNATRKALFLSIREIAALHPQIEELQAALLVARPVGASRSSAMKKLMEEATTVDVLHDALARAVDSGLTTDRLCSFAGKPADLHRAEQAEEASAKLFPNGMAIVNASLVAESGNTARVATLLAQEPELAAFLDQIPVRGGTLLGLTRRWITVGKKLGNLERDRATLAAKETTEPRDASALTRLRAEWIGLVSLVLANLERSKADRTAIATIRGPVLEASARAGKRYDLSAAVATAEAPDAEALEEATPESEP
jgi:hypothetical protein